MEKKAFKLQTIIISMCALVCITSLIVSNNPFTEKRNTKDVKLTDLASSNLIFPSSNQNLQFVANHGQAGQEAKFHVQGIGHTVLFYEDKIEFRKRVPEKGENEIVLKFKGSNSNPNIEGKNKMTSLSNYYLGSDPNNWQVNVPNYSTVYYEQLYPGIDMAYIGNNGNLESEF